jgi:hypothetical protein
MTERKFGDVLYGVGAGHALMLVVGPNNQPAWPHSWWGFILNEKGSSWGRYDKTEIVAFSDDVATWWTDVEPEQ